MPSTPHLVGPKTLQEQSPDLRALCWHVSWEKGMKGLGGGRGISGEDTRGRRETGRDFRGRCPKDYGNLCHPPPDVVCVQDCLILL